MRRAPRRRTLGGGNGNGFLDLFDDTLETNIPHLGKKRHHYENAVHEFHSVEERSVKERAL